MLILNFDLGAHSCGIFQKIFYLFIFFLDRTGQILHLFVYFSGLSPLLLHLGLKLIDKRVQLFNLAVFILELALQGSIILRLLLLRILLQRRPQLIDFVESVPDLDLVLGVHDLAQAFQLLAKVLRR